MRKVFLTYVLLLLTIQTFAQWSGTGSTVTTPATEVIINNSRQQSATIWLTPTNTGPTTGAGNYYFKAFDFWGSNFHFQGTGDNGNERMNVTVDGKFGIGTTSPSNRLEVSGDQTTNRISQSGGTYTELAQRTWSGSAGLLFSAYASDSYVNGGLSTTGNTKYKFNASVFGSSSHRAKMIYTDHSSIGFYISPPSTGADNDISWGTPVMWLKGGGNVGIGTNDPLSKLSVKGQIRATEVKVLADITVPDYVFEPNYELRTLKETKEYITQNKHLPEIPSASEIGMNGIDLGDMNMRLLKKIEELTLYQIELLEKLEQQGERLQEVEKELQILKK